MPTLNEVGRMVEKLEQAKDFSHEIENKIVRLEEEVKEVKIAYLEFKNKTQAIYTVQQRCDNLAEELVDCIFFACSALNKLGVDADKMFLWKYNKNMTRTKSKYNLDSFSD